MAAPAFVYGQASFVPQGTEYGIAGTLAGDQVNPQVSLKTSGGFLIWQDNITDGDGWGVSARRLDASFSGTLGSFRVNQTGAYDQERPQVSLLNDGGAAFVWQGGKQGFQRIYARFLSSSNTWATSDVLVNTFSNSQVDPVVTTLADGNVVVAWAGFTNSMRDVYAQRLSPTGQRLGSEFLVNQSTAYNQRSPAIATLTDGRFLVVWISEQQRFENSVDVYARFYLANGAPVGGEFLVNAGTNVCASPSVVPSADGGFVVAWMQKDIQVSSNSWDIFARPFSGGGFGGVVRRVNTQTYGDQLGPRISAIASDYLVVWTSMGQDGSREGVYGQFLRGDGSLAGEEFRVNSTTVSQQIHPAVASDRSGRFLVAWTSFGGGLASFDLFAQRYVNTGQPLAAPSAPFISVLDSASLGLTWPGILGLSVANYEVYADGAVTATAVVTNTFWNMTGLSVGSTHTFRLAYVLTDGRRSPLSVPASATTFAYPFTWGGIPYDWMIQMWGSDVSHWPSANADNDGDGVSNLQEFLQGTNPNDSDSVLRYQVRSTMQGLFLDWNTQPGLMYQVQSAPAPGVTWANVGGPRFAAGTNDSIYVGGSSAGFYRIGRLR